MSEDTLLADMLVRLGCRTDRADQVIADAIKDGEDLDYLRKQIEAWTAYCLGPRGQSVNAIGFFIAAKIEQNQPAPDLTPRHTNVAAAWQTYLKRYHGSGNLPRTRETMPAYTLNLTRTPRHDSAAFKRALTEILNALYERQAQWVEKQFAFDEAVNLLGDNGFEVERAPWSWSDGPDAAEIARYETLLEAAEA